MNHAFSPLQLGMASSVALALSVVLSGFGMQAVASSATCSPVLDAQGNCIYLICDESPRLRTCDQDPE